MKTKLKTAALVCTLTALPLATAFAAPEFSGDIRFRNELISKDTSATLDTTQFRQRVKATLAAAGTVDENVLYKIKLISGSSDPVSGNQTLDGGFSSKQINIDLAYMTYKCDITGIDLTLGKMKNPFFKPGKTELIWDGDLNFEGIGIDKEFGSFFVSAGYFFAEERSAAPDTILHAIQTGMKLDNDSWKLKTAIGFYNYLAMHGNATLVKTTDSFGNTTASSKYAKNYGLADIAIQFDLKKSNISVFANAVRNTAVNKDHSGYLAGFSYGKKLKFNYNYRRIEADAVVGAFTDSDFHGGGTDGKGHEFGLSYKIGKHQKLAFSHFMNKQSLTTDLDYNRSQLDYSIKF